jgi:hypothetical protein
MMTLGNMRANGVHTLAVYCENWRCHHHAALDVSGGQEPVYWSRAVTAQS